VVGFREKGKGRRGEGERRERGVMTFWEGVDARGKGGGEREGKKERGGPPNV